MDSGSRPTIASRQRLKAAPEAHVIDQNEKIFIKNY